MQNMKCIECVLKHLATALSFGKQIISGHSIGNELDHRIDFLGQITNSEQHLQLIDNSLFIEISNFRKSIQSRNVLVNMSDLQFLRQLYLKVEKYSNNIQIINNDFILQFNPDVVYLNVSNKNYFDLSYKTIKKYLKNYNKIYVYNSTIDLSEYQDVTELNDQELTQYIIVIKQNMGLNKETNARQIPTTYSRVLNKDLILQISPRNNKLLLNYDNLKLQFIKFENFNNLNNKNYLLTAYHYNNNVQIGEDDNLYSIQIKKEICCSIKRELQTKKYVRWMNQQSFLSYKNFFENS